MLQLLKLLKLAARIFQVTDVFVYFLTTALKVLVIAL